MKVLNGRIKANLPCVIGLKTLDATNSRIVIETNGLEKLTVKGRAILKYDELIEFQPMFITVKQARDLIKHTYREEKVDEIKSKEEKKNNKIKNEIKVGEVKDFEFLKLLVGGKR